MRIRLFKVATVIAGGYHTLLGLAGLLFPLDVIVKVVAMVFGIVLEVGSQLSLILKFTSVYLLVFGVMLLVLSSNPVRYRGLAIPALILFGTRFVNRLVLFAALTAAGMPVIRNVVGTAQILILFLVIAFCLPKKQSKLQNDGKSSHDQ
ncbi:MAG: hypothetical protein QM496_16105 [Verrucomicrobiota bacterium]